MKIHCCRIVIGVLFAIVVTGCASAPLSLWQEKAPARVALVEYVNAVTARGSADYIPFERRIAVFDLDGTLFLETDPTYFDWLLFEHRVLEDPEFRERLGAEVKRRSAAYTWQKRAEIYLNGSSYV